MQQCNDTHMAFMFEQKDGGVTKRILVVGAGWEKPEKGDKVEGGSPADTHHCK